MTLCPACVAEADRWLDYKLPPTNPRLVAIGTPQVGSVREFYRLRHEEWRRRINTQLDLIRANCTTNHQPKT